MDPGVLEFFGFFFLSLLEFFENFSKIQEKGGGGPFLCRRCTKLKQGCPEDEGSRCAVLLPTFPCLTRRGRAGGGAQNLGPTPSTAKSPLAPHNSTVPYPSPTNAPRIFYPCPRVASPAVHPRHFHAPPKPQPHVHAPPKCHSGTAPGSLFLAVVLNPHPIYFWAQFFLSCLVGGSYRPWPHGVPPNWGGGDKGLGKQYPRPTQAPAQPYSRTADNRRRSLEPAPPSPPWTPPEQTKVTVVGRTTFTKGKI